MSHENDVVFIDPPVAQCLICNWRVEREHALTAARLMFAHVKTQHPEKADAMLAQMYREIAT